jgi:hypothetical protein
LPHLVADLRCRGFATDFPVVGLDRLRFAIPGRPWLPLSRCGNRSAVRLRAATRMFGAAIIVSEFKSHLQLHARMT